MQNLLGGKYILKEIIGNGGSGIVYKAYDPHLNCEVAVKQFMEKQFTEDTGQALWEMDWMKELRHPAFPTVLDYVEEEDGRYLVMEYIEGICLLDYIEENGSVEQELAVKWMLELAEVFLYLHERSQPVIYRDVKPSNIIIDRMGKVRLLDFGTVCLQYQEETREGKYVGTKGYAAPEQLECGEAKWVDERCDIYGLGATLFHMLTGCNPSKPPFLIQPIRSYNRKLSIELEKIVAKATAWEKGKRYATVRRFKQELERYQRKDRLRDGWQIFVETGYYVCITCGILRFWWIWAEMERLENRSHLEKEVLLTAIALISLCVGKSLRYQWKRRGKRSVRQERNLVLTEKKGIGLLQILVPVLIAVSLLTGQSRAATDENTLWVNVRNEKGQKLLIRYDAEYVMKDTLRLELPLENFEKGESYELRLDCTNRETGESHSRIFYLKGLEP